MRGAVLWGVRCASTFCGAAAAVAAASRVDDRDKACRVPGPANPVDVCIIGGGVVGIAVARQLAVAGAHCTVLEGGHDLAASPASAGNSGIGCTGYDAAEGSLERRLIRRSLQIHQPILRSCGLNHNHVRKSGALVIAWTDEEVDSLQGVLDDNRRAGDTEAVLLSQSELRELEPSLSSAAKAAVLLPREAVAEPWLVPVVLAEAARLHGARFVTDAKVVGVRLCENGVWRLCTANGLSYYARQVVNAAGLHGDTVQALAEEVLGVEGQERSKGVLKISPRQGQFLVLAPPREGCAPRHVAARTPTERTKGVLIWETLHGNVIVGPTCEDVDARDVGRTDAETLSSLRETACKAFPCLCDVPSVGSYAGLRPAAAEERDYVISTAPQKGWMLVGGIRSTGLTAATGIAEHVSIALGYGQAGTSAPDTSVEPPYEPTRLVRDPQQLPEVPPLKELASDMRARGDGCVKIWPHSNPVRVTHPQSRMGMQ